MAVFTQIMCKLQILKTVFQLFDWIVFTGSETIFYRDQEFAILLVHDLECNWRPYIRIRLVSN